MKRLFEMGEKKKNKKKAEWKREEDVTRVYNCKDKLKILTLADKVRELIACGIKKYT